MEAKHPTIRRRFVDGKEKARSLACISDKGGKERRRGEAGYDDNKGGVPDLSLKKENTERTLQHFVKERHEGS